MKCSNINKCEKCKYLSICRYCPAKFFMETNNYEVPPSWYCEFSNAVFDNYISGYRFIRKKLLTSEEVEQLYSIIAENMRSLGFDVKEGDKDLWCNRLIQDIRNNTFYLFVIYFNGKICGFVEIFETADGLFLSEFEIASWCQGTRVILFAINKLLNYSEFKNFNTIKFKINKTNKLSEKTFKHLGAERCGETEKSNIFLLTRGEVDKFCNKFDYK